MAGKASSTAELRRLPHARATRARPATIGPNLDDGEARPDARRRPRHERQGRDAGVQGPAHASSRSQTSRPTSSRRRPADPAPGRLPARRRGRRLRPRPHADRGRTACLRPRTLAALAGGARGRDPRDRRHGPDVAVGAAVRSSRPASTIRSSATRARSSPTATAAGCATCRSRSSSRARRSPRSQAEGYAPNVLRRRRALRRARDARGRGLRELPAPRDPCGRRPRSPGSTAPPTKLVCVGDPAALDELERAAARALRRAGCTSRSRCRTSSSSRART